MPQSINTYGGGGAPTTTRTEVNAGPGGPSGFYDASFMNFLRRRRSPASEPAQQERRLPTPNESALDNAKTRALLAQYKAESEPAPMIYAPGGPGMGGARLEMDIHNMTGAQREKFLPQDSESIPNFDAGRGSAIKDDVTRGMGSSGVGAWGQKSAQDLEAEKSGSIDIWGGVPEIERERLVREFYSTMPKRGDQSGQSRRG